MIRDPSDGSVKEISQQASETNALPPEKPSKEITSGLPLESQRAAYQEKLERSRDWLRKYRTNPEKVVREQGEQPE
jgi:hypothetical protein